MATVLVGMAAGFWVARLLGFEDAAVQSAIVCSLTFSAGGSGRLRTAFPVALVLGLIVVAYSTIGALTTGYPWAAALAMAFVAFTTTVMTAAKPVGLLVGMVASYAYFLVTAVGVLESRAIGGGIDQIAVLGAIGLVTGLALVTLRALLEQAIGTAPVRAQPRTSPSLLAPMIASVRTFDPVAKDAARRAIALGLAMLAFQMTANHDAFWVFLTVFVILQPNGRSTVRSALLRVAGTLIGVVGLTVVSGLLPDAAAMPLALVALALSLVLSSRSTWLSVALGAAAASVLVGLPHDDIRGYAASRLIDTIIGAAFALAAGYLLWPHTRSTETAVPSDLTGEASSAGVAVPGR